MNEVKCSSHGSYNLLLDIDCFVYIAALSLAHEDCRQYLAHKVILGAIKQPVKLVITCVQEKKQKKHKTSKQQTKQDSQHGRDLYTQSNWLLQARQPV